jgi:O-antigen/teichoic acid export membrane protein
MSLKGLILISVIRYLWLLLLIKKYSLFSVSLKFIKEHLHYAYPLIISTLLGGSAHYVDGLLVLSGFDQATFAVFSYGAREFPLVLLMANALSAAIIPEFSAGKNLEPALMSLKKRSATLMHLLFPVTILFLLFSKQLYPIIFNPEFSDSAGIFNIYLLLIISRLVFPHSVLIGLKKMKIIMHASLAELIINISLSVLLIRFLGIEGVAIATIIAYAAQKIIWIVYNKKVLGILPGNYIPLTKLTVYSVITIIIFLLVYFKDSIFSII